jgi:ketosteroid isomerase-like protein
MGAVKNGFEEGVRAKLTIIARNAAPLREASFTSTWLVHSVDQTITVYVMRYQESRRPYIEEKRRPEAS